MPSACKSNMITVRTAARSRQIREHSSAILGFDVFAKLDRPLHGLIAKTRDDQSDAISAIILAHADEITTSTNSVSSMVPPTITMSRRSICLSQR
ncbi:unnamed protein product [Sphagnum balticum]